MSIFKYWVIRSINTPQVYKCIHVQCFIPFHQQECIKFWCLTMEYVKFLLSKRQKCPIIYLKDLITYRNISYFKKIWAGAFWHDLKLESLTTKFSHSLGHITLWSIVHLVDIFCIMESYVLDRLQQHIWMT
jgi:hypothetical protein